MFLVKQLGRWRQRLWSSLSLAKFWRSVDTGFSSDEWELDGNESRDYCVLLCLGATVVGHYSCRAWRERKSCFKLLRWNLFEPRFVRHHKQFAYSRLTTEALCLLNIYISKQYGLLRVYTSNDIARLRWTQLFPSSPSSFLYSLVSFLIDAPYRFCWYQKIAMRVYIYI